jgi:hypothetical protein
LLAAFAANSKEFVFSWQRILNNFGVACYQLVLLLLGIDWQLNGGWMASNVVVYFSGISNLNLWLSQPQDGFVVGTVRAQRLSHFRCLATASNGAG